MENENGQNEEKKEHTGRFLWVIFLIFCGLCLIDFLWLKKYSTPISLMGWETEWNWGWTAFWIQAAYILLSFRQVGPRDTGVLLFFGNPILKVESGLVFVPRGIIELETITKIVREIEYPDPKRVWRGDEKKEERPKGKIPPIRVIQGENEDKAKKDPLHKRLTTEISVIVRYRVADFMTFIGTIGSLEELDKTIEDLLIASIRRDLAIVPAAQALKEWGDIEKKSQIEIEDLVKKWGVEVQTVRVKEIDVGHTVNTALRDIIASTLKKTSTIVDAEAEKQRRELEGMGLAKAKEVLLEAEAIGYKKIAEELKLKESELVLIAETVKTLTEKSQYTLLAGSGGIADLFGVIGAIKNVLPKVK